MMRISLMGAHPDSCHAFIYFSVDTEKCKIGYKNQAYGRQAQKNRGLLYKACLVRIPGGGNEYAKMQRHQSTTQTLMTTGQQSFPYCQRWATCILVVLLSVILLACGTTGSNKPVGEGYYRVQRGDTLSSISRRHGQSVANLSRWNNLSDPSKIEVGQVLRVRSPAGKTTTGGKKTTQPKRTTTTTPKPATGPAVPARSIALQWPATGKVLLGFNPTSNKGINIGGTDGAPIHAAAAGKVVYAGDGLRQYGNLLIIKHDADYLTVYAHNRSLLVKEGDSVKQGQPVATMGDTGSDSGVMLHFELRYRGKTIDPMPYLVKR